MLRVTIFGKAKIGTMDGDFSRDQIYGLFKVFFYQKRDAEMQLLTCVLRDRFRFKKINKKGVISKKKKKVITCLPARFVSFSGRKLHNK